VHSVRKSTFFSHLLQHRWCFYYTFSRLLSARYFAHFIGCQASRDATYDATLTELRARSRRSSRKIKYTRYNTSDKWVTSYTHVTWLTRTGPQALTEEVHEQSMTLEHSTLEKQKKQRFCNMWGKKQKKKNLQVCGSRPPTHTQNTLLISICNENFQKCHCAKCVQFHVEWQQNFIILPSVQHPHTSRKVQ